MMLKEANRFDSFSTEKSDILPALTHFQLSQHPHDHIIRICVVDNWHVLRTVIASQGHVITIYDFPRQLPISKVNAVIDLTTMA